MDDALKLADFGSCRGIYSKQVCLTLQASYP